jgi:hypothetical protein
VWKSLSGILKRFKNGVDRKAKTKKGKRSADPGHEGSIRRKNGTHHPQIKGLLASYVRRWLFLDPQVFLLFLAVG